MAAAAPPAVAALDDETRRKQLYDRQRYVVGAETQKKYGEMRVLVVGLSGTGCELVKDIVLTGIKHVTVVDNDVVTWGDLSSMFYAKPADVGKRRTDVLLPKLAELNRFVTVSAAADVTPALVEEHHVVCYVDHPTVKLQQANALAREKGARFISAESRGVCGCIFVDAGASHTVLDKNGEEIMSCIVTGIDKDGIVTLHDDKKPDIEVGDKVYFTGVQGPTVLNSADEKAPVLFTIKDAISPYAFKVGVPEGFAAQPDFFGQGAYMHQTKQPVVVSHKPLSEQVGAPELFFYSEVEEKFCASNELHTVFRAVHETGDAATAHLRLDAIVAAAAAIDKDVPADAVRALAWGFRGNLNPMACLIGALACQEILKVGSGKFTPFGQFFYCDSRELLTAAKAPFAPASKEEAKADATLSAFAADEFEPLGCRYDGQIVVIGRTASALLQKQRPFIIGAGALGCEHIKNVAMMGLGCGPEGRVTLTDMDTIELSNLSRQFLFRDRHIKTYKSVSAAEAAVEMNDAMRIDARTDKVARETEHIFNDKFWEETTMVLTALDAVPPRKYSDERCVYFGRPMFDSGTTGAKCNTLTVIPQLTENYGAQNDPVEQTIPLCTLKNKPTAIEHTIQWARDAFHGCFTSGPGDVNAYLTDPGFVAGLERDPGQKPSVFQNLVNMIGKKPADVEGCVRRGRGQFDEYFNLGIRQLLHNMPADMVDASGVPVWGGAKKAPGPIEFDATNAEHVDFVFAAARLCAETYGYDPAPISRALVAKVAGAVPAAVFVPKVVKYAMDEKEAKEDAAKKEAAATAAVDLTERDLPSRAAHQGLKMVPLEFEKDEDENNHILFITSCSNLRARNYGIPPVDFTKTKLIAGKIIPAMITTTAVATAFVGFEVLKYAAAHRRGLKDRTLYRNAFCNIAVPSVVLSEPGRSPEGCKYTTADGREIVFTMWDRVDVGDGSKDMTIGEVISTIESKYGLEICMMSTPAGQLVYNGMMTKPEKLKQSLRGRLEEILKKPLDEGTSTVTLILNASVNDEDVDVPSVRYRFR